MEVCGYIRSEFEVLHTFHHSVNEGQKILKLNSASFHYMQLNQIKTILILDLKTLFRVCCFY